MLFFCADDWHFVTYFELFLSYSQCSTNKEEKMLHVCLIEENLIFFFLHGAKAELLDGSKFLLKEEPLIKTSFLERSRELSCFSEYNLSSKLKVSLEIGFPKK